MQVKTLVCPYICVARSLRSNHWFYISISNIINKSPQDANLYNLFIYFTLLYFLYSSADAMWCRSPRRDSSARWQWTAIASFFMVRRRNCRMARRLSPTRSATVDSKFCHRRWVQRIEWLTWLSVEWSVGVAKVDRPTAMKTGQNAINWNYRVCILIHTYIYLLYINTFIDVCVYVYTLSCHLRS